MSFLWGGVILEAVPIEQRWAKDLRGGKMVCPK